MALTLDWTQWTGRKLLIEGLVRVVPPCFAGENLGVLGLLHHEEIWGYILSFLSSTQV